MQRHIPVLADQICDYIPDNTKVIFDWTLGHWWHAEVILEYYLSKDKSMYDDLTIIWVDRDEKILEKAKNNLNKYKNKIFYANNSYAEIEEILQKANVWKVDFFFLDIWVNMEHFKDGNRGFSIKERWPLDMRFDIRQQKTAESVINTYSESELSKIFELYWDFSKKTSDYIAQWIIQERKKEKIDTTEKLMKLLDKLHLGIKKVTVIFQCIRIEVNDELNLLQLFLQNFTKYISLKGRCAIISYHSIEDRIVKLAFKELESSGKWKTLTKHVIKPTYLEVQKNRAARSAKLRIIENL